MSSDRYSGNPLEQFVDAVASTELGNGMCSWRVQRLINITHYKLSQDKKPENLDTINPFTEEESPLTLLPLGRLPESDWKLFAQETGELGEVRQDIYVSKPEQNGLYKRAVLAFSWLEKANDDDCSVSLCWLAEPSSGLDWSVVSTSADDARPVNIDESLKEIPQTNAEILDSLIELLSGSARVQDGAKLAETLLLDSVWKRHCPDIAHQLNDYARPRFLSRRIALGKQILHIGQWLDLDEDAMYQDSLSTGSGRALHIEQQDSSGARVEHVVKNLGTKPKATELGRIILGDSGLPIFVAIPALDSLITEEVTEDILTQAEKIYDIPEIYSNPEISEEIDSIINDLLINVPPESQAEEFNKRLQILIESTQRRAKDQENLEGMGWVLDLGQIDISQLGPGQYFNYHLGIDSSFSADIKANNSQFIFFGDEIFKPKLYDCTVNGAAGAYKYIKGQKLIAIGCNEAYDFCEVQDSVAKNVGRAFYKSEAKGCVAESCEKAFTSEWAQSNWARNSIAINCSVAFVGIDIYSSRNLTAVFCTRVFENKYFKSILRKTRKEQSMVSVGRTVNSSFITAYRAGRRYGPITEYSK